MDTTLERINNEASDKEKLNRFHSVTPVAWMHGYKVGAISERNRTVDYAIEKLKDHAIYYDSMWGKIYEILESLKINQ